ncbi:MAG: histidine--tRNA ligase, partial [Haemophilus parainfluenzae]|nr:histidine--tRNA ligase [Haemophilus parainfluenzae]
GATLALVLGESEVQNNQVVLKHLLGAEEQQTIDVDNLIEHVKAQF